MFLGKGHEFRTTLKAFVEHPPHVRLMAALAPHMEKTKFVRWTVKGPQLPLRWDDALRRFVGTPLLVQKVNTD